MTASSSDKFATVNGLNLHYRDWGGSGLPIVLVHGLASTSHIWDFVAPILAGAYRVVALDQRGHGQSDKPDDGYDFHTVTTDLRDFIDLLGFERPIVAGHSWGAQVALTLAHLFPEKVRGICFVDGGFMEISSRPDMTPEKARELLAPPDLSHFTIDQFREMVRTRDWGFEFRPGLEEIVTANFDVQPDRTIRPRLSHANHFKIIDSLWDHRPSEIFPTLDSPVLIMPARRDGDDDAPDWRAQREEAVARAESLLRRGKTVWLEDSVHDVPLQRPELVAQTIADHIENGFFD